MARNNAVGFKNNNKRIAKIAIHSLPPGNLFRYSVKTNAVGMRMGRETYQAAGYNTISSNYIVNSPLHIDG